MNITNTIIRLMLLSLMMVVTITESAAQGTPNNAAQGERRKTLYTRFLEMEFAAVERELNLHGEEQRLFHGLYKEYQDKMLEVGKRKATTLHDRGAQMDDTQIEHEIEVIIQRNIRCALIKKEYYEKFRTVLSSRQLAQLYYAERKIRERLIAESYLRNKQMSAPEPKGKKGNPDDKKVAPTQN